MPKSKRESVAKEHFSANFAVVESNPEEGTFRGLASVFGSMVDAWCPTVFERGAFTKTLQENARRFRVLYQHNDYEPLARPGLGLSPFDLLRQTDAGLEIGGKISQTARGKDAIVLLRDKVIDELSIGHDPIKCEMMQLSDVISAGLLLEPERYSSWSHNEPIRVVKEARLWEASFVTWGADPMAKVIEAHAVVPFQNLPLAEEDLKWDAAGAMKRMKEACAMDGDSPDWTKFRKAHLWYDADEPEKMGSYKFPVADLVDGKMMCVPRAVFAAAGRLGSADIPAEDLPGMKAHLGRYYKAMERKAPWEDEKDSLELILETLAALPSFETQEGKVLSGKNTKLLKDCMAALQALLAAAEPPPADADGIDDGQALTATADLERLTQERDRFLALAQMQLTQSSPEA